MTQKNNKCVYVHKLDGVVVYVGMGSVRRPYKKDHRSIDHLKIWDKLEKVIIVDNLSFNDACDLEYKLICDNLKLGNNLFNKRIRKKNRTLHINYEYISGVLEYDPTSKSSLRWIVDRPSVIKAGDEAGRKSGNYFSVKVDQIEYKCHRLIYCLCTKKDLYSDLVINHIDGNGLNNNFENLELVTQRDNQLSRKDFQTNTGEQYIFHEEKNLRYFIRYSEYNKQNVIFFNYGLSEISDPNFKSKEAAYEAAINQREILFSSGILRRR